MDPKFNGIVWTGTNLLDVTAPDIEAIHAIDIARGLTRKFRFGGHTRSDLPPYSVAWHSLFCEMVADQMGLPVWVRIQALLHDAPEYVLCDMITPVKRLLPDYAALEEQLWFAIAQKYGVPMAMHPAVHEIDNIALNVERLHLVAPHSWDPAPHVPDEWVTVGAKWIEFCQARAPQADTLAAALFHSRLTALLDALAQEVVE